MVRKCENYAFLGEIAVTLTTTIHLSATTKRDSSELDSCNRKSIMSSSYPEETVMAHFVTLVRYTLQGIAKIKESPARLDAAKQAAEKAGGRIHAWYLTMGRY